jgi:hypothetical protein
MHSPPGRDHDQARTLATAALVWGENPTVCPSCPLFDDCLGVSGLVDFMRGEVEELARHMTPGQRAALRRRATTGLRRFQELEARCPRQPRA